MDSFIVILILCCICLLCLISIAGTIFTVNTSNSSINSLINQVRERLKTTIDTSIQLKQVDQTQLKIKVDQVNKSRKQLDCTVNLNKSTCSDPTNNKIITLKN